MRPPGWNQTSKLWHTDVLEVGTDGRFLNFDFVGGPAAGTVMSQVPVNDFFVGTYVYKYIYNM